MNFTYYPAYMKFIMIKVLVNEKKDELNHKNSVISNEKKC